MYSDTQFSVKYSSVSPILTVGKLNYLSVTLKDIAFSLTVISQVM